MIEAEVKKGLAPKGAGKLDALFQRVVDAYLAGDTKSSVKLLVKNLKMGPHQVRIKANFPTACWFFQNGSHVICLGDLVLERVVKRWAQVWELTAPVPETLTFASFLTYTHTLLELADAESADDLADRLLDAMIAYSLHERGHALYTPQDLKKVNADLRTFKLPFSLFNLFEDARIEAQFRRDSKGYFFGWEDLEALAPMTTPIALFLRCIQMEETPDADALACVAPFGKTGKTVQEVALRVQEYYLRACLPQSATGLYPLMMEFLKEFPQEPESAKDKEKGEGEGEGEGQPGDGKGEPSEGSGSGSGSGSKPKPDDKAKEAKKPPKGKSGEKGEKAEKGEDKPEKGEGSASAEASKEEEEGEAKGASADEAPEPSGAEVRGEDLSIAAQAAEDPKFLAEFLEDTTLIGGDDAQAQAQADAQAKAKAKGEGKSTSKSASQGIPESVTPASIGGRVRECDFLASQPGELDAAYRKKVADMTRLLKAMFEGVTLMGVNENDGRISMRHAAVLPVTSVVMYRKKQIIGGLAKRKISLFYDCSGSMRGNPDRQGKVLLLALNNLAKAGFIEGSLILSGWANSSPAWLTYDFPVKEEIILRIAPNHGHEGLQGSIAGNLARIHGSHNVFVYTDACITDAPMDQAFLKKKKVFPIGIYIGEENKTTEMIRHFPQNIVSSEVKDAVIRLVKLGKRQSRS